MKSHSTQRWLKPSYTPVPFPFLFPVSKPVNNRDNHKYEIQNDPIHTKIFFWINKTLNTVYYQVFERRSHVFLMQQSGEAEDWSHCHVERPTITDPHRGPRFVPTYSGSCLQIWQCISNLVFFWLQRQAIGMRYLMTHFTWRLMWVGLFRPSGFLLVWRLIHINRSGVKVWNLCVFV